MIKEVQHTLSVFVRGSNISMTLKNCGELSTVPQFIYCFFAFYCNKDSWYVGHDTWLACQRSRVRFREETFFLARKNLRNLRTLTSESILEILAPMDNWTLDYSQQQHFIEVDSSYLCWTSSIFLICKSSSHVTTLYIFCNISEVKVLRKYLFHNQRHA